MASLADVEARAELGSVAIRSAVEACDEEVRLLPPASVSEVIVGEVLAGGVRPGAGTAGERHAGLPDSIHAMTINKVCGSGLKAIMLGAGSIRSGDSDLVIAGGMESMSLAPYLLKRARTGYRLGNGELIDFSRATTASVIRNGEPPYGRDRRRRTRPPFRAREPGGQDDYAARSYPARASAAMEGRRFKDEIVPVPVKKTKKGDEAVVETDEGPSRWTSRR